MIWSPHFVSVVLFCIGTFCLSKQEVVRAAYHGAQLLQTPPQAAAFGFTKLAFFDGFGTLGTTDVNQTHDNTFNWYTDNAQFIPAICTGVVPSPSWWALIGGVFNISTNTSTCGGYEMQSFRYTGGSSYYSQVPLIVGASGFYMEFYGQYELMGGSNSEGGAWLEDIDALLAQLQQSGSGFSKAEIDVGEASSSNGGMYFLVHRWTSYASVAESYGSSVNPFNSPDFTQFHKWGVRLVPKALNGGTGELTFWFDGSALGTPCTYTNSAASCGAASQDLGTALEASNYALMFNAGVNSNKMQAKYYAVWTP